MLKEMSTFDLDAKHGSILQIIIIITYEIYMGGMICINVYGEGYFTHNHSHVYIEGVGATTETSNIQSCVYVHGCYNVIIGGYDVNSIKKV